MIELGYQVTSIDLNEKSDYKQNYSRVITYDGKKIPFSDSTFDLIFSSHVLEHVKDVEKFQYEISRVLKKNGFALHLMPTGSWKF